MFSIKMGVCITYYPKRQSGALAPPLTRNLWTKAPGAGRHLAARPRLRTGKEGPDQWWEAAAGHKAASPLCQGLCPSPPSLGAPRLLYGLPAFSTGSRWKEEGRGKSVGEDHHSPSCSQPPPPCGRAGWGREERRKCWPCRRETLAERSNCDSKSEITRGGAARPRPPQQALGHSHLEGQ